MSSNLDKVRGNEVCQWIEQVTGEHINIDNFYESLKNGVILCNLLNKLEPGTISNINHQNMPFKQMENIAAYIEGSRKLGVPDEYNFVTVDLYEAKNLNQVIQNLMALKRIKAGTFQKSTSQNSNSSSIMKNSNVKDQSTEAKSQIDLISREPISLKTENDIKIHGSAKISGRHTNTEAMKCPICTKFITSGAVNAIGKSWHPNCFTCKKCNIKLSTAKYYEYQDQPYCERCILIVKPASNVKTVEVKT